MSTSTFVFPPINSELTSVDGTSPLSSKPDFSPGGWTKQKDNLLSKASDSETVYVNTAADLDSPMSCRVGHYVKMPKNGYERRNVSIKLHFTVHEDTPQGAHIHHDDCYIVLAIEVPHNVDLDLPEIERLATLAFGFGFPGSRAQDGRVHNGLGAMTSLKHGLTDIDYDGTVFATP